MLRMPVSEVPTAGFATHMLAAGILRESDWCGSVTESLNRGVERWVSEILGGEELRRIELGIFWTDDLQERAAHDPSAWILSRGGAREEQLRRLKEPVGALGILSPEVKDSRYQHGRDVIVGKVVQILEAARPGLGWQLLYLLQEVLPPLLWTATPMYGLHEAIRRQELLWKGYSAEELEAGGVLTPERYLRNVPRQACDGELRPGIIREAARAGLPSERLTAIARQGAAVLAAWKRLGRNALGSDSHILAAPGTQMIFVGKTGCAPADVPFAVRWSPDDELPRVVDDYHHQIRSRGAATPLLWTRAFQEWTPDDLGKAVRHWRDVVTCALKACRLAEMLHSDEPAEPQSGEPQSGEKGD